jgi:hypothetical protein
MLGDVSPTAEGTGATIILGRPDAAVREAYKYLAVGAVDVYLPRDFVEVYVATDEGRLRVSSRREVGVNFHCVSLLKVRSGIVPPGFPLRLRI